MKELLHRTTIAVNRRRLLRNTAATAFGVLAGAAVGGGPAYAGGCTGPYNTGACYSNNCPDCRNAYPRHCWKVTGFCETGTACWRSSGHTCCKCKCDYSGRAFYCYCHRSW